MERLSYHPMAKSHIEELQNRFISNIKYIASKYIEKKYGNNSELDSKILQHIYIHNMLEQLDTNKIESIKENIYSSTTFFSYYIIPFTFLEYQCFDLTDNVKKYLKDQLSYFIKIWFGDDYDSLINNSITPENEDYYKYILQVFYTYFDDIMDGKEVIINNKQIDIRLNKDIEIDKEIAKQYQYKDEKIIVELLNTDEQMYDLTYFLSDELKRNKIIALASVKNNPYSYEYLDEELKNDKEIAFVAITKNGSLIEYLGEELKKDKEFILELIKTIHIPYDYVLRFVDESLRKDKDVALAAINKNGMELTFVNESLKKDKEVVLAAVKRNGRALEFADESLKNDKEIVLEAIKENGYALLYASNTLINDKDLQLKAVRSNGMILGFLDDELKKDKDVLLKAVRNNGEALQYVPEEFRKDREIVLTAVKSDGRAIEYADSSLRKDKEILIAAIDKWYFAKDYVDETLKNDEDIKKAIREKIRRTPWECYVY